MSTNISVSVIVPVFEQWHLVPALLRCMVAQSYPQERFEVLLVDNGSQEMLPPEPLAPNVEVLHCTVRGSYAARNHGVEHSRGDWLVFTDADCLPHRDWLCELGKALISESCDSRFFAGAVEVVGSRDKPTIYEVYDMVRGIPQAHYVNRGYAATANLAVPRRMVDRLGGFNGNLYSGGDAEFCRRGKSAGFYIAYIPTAVVSHPARETWAAVATKARRVKGGQWQRKSAFYKLWIVIRTLVSPAISLYRFFNNPRHSIKYRAIAALVYMRVWLVELTELSRVSLGRDPERR